MYLDIKILIFKDASFVYEDLYDRILQTFFTVDKDTFSICKDMNQEGVDMIKMYFNFIKMTEKTPHPSMEP